MISIKNGKVVAIIFLFAVSMLQAANLYVSKPGGLGAYNTIMSAINDSKPGDSVIIMDDGIYEEQVTIDSTKSGLVLTSENPTSKRKPKIKWQDKVNIGPKTWAEAQVESKITFDQNGALQVKRVRGVVIDGIAIDGGGAFTFGKDTIWGPQSGQRFPMQHGNAAITLWIAGDAIIRNCDISNAFIGINVKDRNEGGIFANANPADIAVWAVVPLSGFGKTGNHLVERNRIHNNSFGMFFESTWDLSTVIRYNLIYENHHHSTSFGAEVKKLTNEGTNLPGGAFMFKDHLLSPTAIYNNTLWQNFCVLIGVWRPGNQYLVFNNIFARPNIYWSLDPNYQNPFHEISPKYNNRMHNCVFGSQSQAPQEYHVQVMNGFQTEASGGPLKQGLLINNPFPSSADIRWLETKFKSTDTASPDFLVPDWEDTLVKKYIIDKGWPEAGILDDDGSIADLGAISYSGIPKSNIIIKPEMPVIIDQSTPTIASVSFSIKALDGTFNNPTIKYIRWIDPLAFNADAFGNGIKPLESSSIHNVQVSSPIKVGVNTFNITIPSHSSTSLYGFFELIAEGTDSEGKKVSSSVGFLPYRKLDYIFYVRILTMDMKDTLSEVTAGMPVKLLIKAVKVGDNKPFTSPIANVDVALASPFKLWDESVTNEFKIPGGIQGSPSGTTSISTVVFTKVPDNELEMVKVSGKFINAGQGNELAIYGNSNEIKVNPGPPEKILFQDPPSQGLGIVDPGQVYNVKIQVYDKYDNKVKQVTAVKLESTKPDIGNVDGAGQVNSNENGVAILQVKVTNGNTNDTFPIVGTLLMNNKTDNAKMIVGKLRNRFYIFYGDTALYDDTVVIPATTCTGVRVPVQIRVSTNGIDTITSINNEFTIEFNNPNLVAYKSESFDDAVPITSAKLVNGIATIWIQATKGTMTNASITVTNLTPENRVIAGNRAGINFVVCQSIVKYGEYHANNGIGRVDQLDLYYADPLKSEADIADSVQIFWPADGENKKIVHRSSMQLDQTNMAHVIVKLLDPFPQEITTSTQQQLGTSYWKSPTLADNQVQPFTIKDKVGPLIMRARLVERLTDNGVDTLILTFSEYVQGSGVIGDAFQLTKNGGVTLKVQKVEQIQSNQLKVVVESQGEDKSPKAGDSIKIFVASDGKSLVVDESNNNAHPDNRPVKIEIQEIAPVVTEAFYEDRDGDGLIDYITMSFAKKVKIGNHKYKINFRSDIVSDTLKNDRASYINGDSTKIVIDLLNGGLPLSAKGYTDGALNISIIDLSFQDPIIGKAEDKAAPVIDSAVYVQGLISENGDFKDTLIIIFSEGIKSGTIVSKPFQFIQTSTNTVYYVSLTEVNNVGKRFVFVVNPESSDKLTSNVKFASTGDSVRIFVESNSSSFTDNAGNFQKVDKNHLERLIVVEQPVELDVRIGPCPFIPKDNEYASIIIAPKIQREQMVKIQASVVIYDNMGNLIFSDDGSSAGKEPLNFKWNGRNKKGRIVGTGTYAVYIKTVDLIKNKSIGPTIRKIAVNSKK